MTGFKNQLALGLAILVVSLGYSSHFFDDSIVHQIRIQFDNPNWYDQLYNGHALDPNDPYFQASIDIDGTTISPVGVRFKGDASFYINSAKKPFKIDFDLFVSGQDFQGMRKLNLNNMYNDPTMLREKLFLDFAGQYVPAVRAVHTRVYINDQYWGLYLAVEQIDKDFIQARFGKHEDGNLYEAAGVGDTDNLGDGQLTSDLRWLGPDPAAYRPFYRLMTNEAANDYSGLIHMIDVLNNTPLDEFKSAIETVLDVNNILYGLALNNLFVNLDSYIGTASNYYLYHCDQTGTFVHLHWATDEAFARTRPYVAEGQDPVLLDPLWVPTAKPDSRPQYRPLMERLWAVPEYRQKYLRILAQMCRAGFNPSDMQQRITRLADIIRQDVYADTNKLYTNDQFEQGLNEDLVVNNRLIYGLREFVATRSQYLDQRLNDFASVYDIRLNELETINNTGPQDELGNHSPWVELVNLGPGRVQTDGLYLTDDQQNPTKWALPNVAIEDGAFYVLWLDGRPELGPAHAPFKPVGISGELLLFDKDLVLIDKLSYANLGADEALGRYPDGTGPWRLMDVPTAGSANKWTYKPPRLYINEIMADNTRTIQDPDEPGAYEDWIEIYNAEDTDVDMSGMILTDRPDDPLGGWRVSKGVIIPAKGYLVFWADNDPEQGPMHTDFGLNKSGESLALFDAAEHGYILIDKVTFGPQSSDISYGRRGDGGSQWRFMSTPTPGKRNPQ